MALTKEDLQAIGTLMDSKLEPIKADIAGLKADVEELKAGHQRLEESQQVIRRSQLAFELEHLPKIGLALDGVIGGVQRDMLQEDRIAYLEKKTGIHDVRLYTLERAAK